jgi:MFS superfamily sulfate permease-like transporter
MKDNKKGAFEVGQLYGFVLTLVLIGMIMGVGILVLDKFQQTSGLSNNSIEAINSTGNAIKDIATTWLGLIVTIVVLAIILTIVIRSFAVRR